MGSTTDERKSVEPTTGEQTSELWTTGELRMVLMIWVLTTEESKSEGKKNEGSTTAVLKNEATMTVLTT
jgi:hypothetical protein